MNQNPKTDSLELRELEETIQLYRDMIAEKQLRVEDAEGPYKEAEEAHRLAHEHLKACGATLSQAKLELSRAETTLQKFEKLRNMNRGGLMFGEKSYAKPEKKGWDFHWMDDAREVLLTEKRPLDIETLFQKIFTLRPEYKGKLKTRPNKRQLVERAKEGVEAAAKRPVEECKKMKVFAWYNGKVCLQGWMDGEKPKPEFLAYRNIQKVA
jgi:hypothetical protein